MPVLPPDLPRGFSLPENAPEDLVVEENDFLDHPNFFYGEEMITDLEEELLFPLFPEGPDENLARAWAELFEGDAGLRLLAPLSATAYTTAGQYSGTGRDTGIANRLRAYGLKVVEVSGWQTRGVTTFHPRGSVDHHTAAGRYGNAPSLNICTYGRSDLPGPLCQVLIGRDNTCFVIAAGRANHAGSGSWKGVTGNSNMYGVEHENTGTGSEPWREDQRVTAALVHAALLDWRRDSGMICEHKEWTSRKIDKWDQTGSDMRTRTQNVWNEGASQDMPLFPTDQSRENFVKSSYLNIAGRQVESQDALNLWKVSIAHNEAAAFDLMNLLTKEAHLAHWRVIQQLSTTAADHKSKLESLKAQVDQFGQGGSGLTANEVIAEISRRLQS